MIVIPMAGLSSRFSAVGYDRPKYMLPLGGTTVFDHAVGSFRTYFATIPFLFVARGGADVKRFVTESCASLGIREARVELLIEPTAGQAETVELGLRAAAVGPDIPLTIFNIDTFRPGFRFPSAAWADHSDGYLEVFEGSGSNWSYVKPSESGINRVAETAEKRPISKLCCTGLYHFTRSSDFFAALASERANPSAKELYVAPMYNSLLRAGREIHYELVPSAQIVFCGIPAEYEALRTSNTFAVSDAAHD